MTKAKAKSRKESSTSVDELPPGEQEKLARGAGVSKEDVESEDTTLVTGNVGMFQLKAARRHLHPATGEATYTEAINLDFGAAGVAAVDDETLEIVEDLLAGKHSDGSVSGKRFQQLARAAGIRIIKPGLEKPPIPAWEQLAADAVVRVARAAGVLSDVESVERAERFERQAKKRDKNDEPRDRVLAELAVVKAELQAGATSNTATGGTANEGGADNAPVSGDAKEL